jgi:predicted phage terminase large subunit-like protein
MQRLTPPRNKERRASTMTRHETQLPADRRLRDAIIRTDFPSFIRKTFQFLSPSATYYDNWHIHAMAYKLEQVRLGKIKRLVITIQPRSLKSLICSIAFPAYILGHDPTKRLIGMSYSQDLATKLSNDCREIMSSPWYRQLFPKTKLSRLKNTETEFATTQMGYRLATSIEGTLTGRGGDIIILDDPLKTGDALSDSKRERVNNAFVNTILSRLDDKRTGAIIIVMQRLHEDDLVGRLLREAPGEWDVLSLPAIAEQEEEIEIGGPQPHVRHLGDLLHEEREPLSILQSLRAQHGSDVFAAQYQQSPVPREGVMIKRTWPRRYERLPERNSSARIIQSWDTAIKGSDQANYSVCTTWLYQDRRYYLIDVFRDRIDYPTLKLQATASAQLHKPNVILVEDAGLGTALAKELHEAGLPAIAVKPKFDKRTRMSIQSAKFESGQVWLPATAPWLDPLETELFSFPGGRYDDQIDSISQALSYEISRGELMTDAALKGYSNLIDGLWFDRLF